MNGSRRYVAPFRLEWRDFESGQVTARERYDHRRDANETANVVQSPPDSQALDAAVRLLEERFPRKGYRHP